jgi:putative ABC transport system permease protein
MPYYIGMAFKNIFREKKRSFTLGINYLIIAFLLLMLSSVSEGVKKNITANILTSTAGHLTISGEYVVKGKTFQGIRDYPKIIETVRKEFGKDVRILTRYNIRSAVYYKGVSKRLQFIGLDTARDTGLRDQVRFIKGSWTEFAEQPNAVCMPQSIADYFGLQYDDELVIATRSRFGAFNTGTIQVKGITRSANFFVQDILISHFDFIQSLDLADKSTASIIFVYFPDLKGLNEKRTKLLADLKYEGFKADKPKDANDAIAAVSTASPRYKVEDENLTEIRLTVSTADEVTGIVTRVLQTINAIGGVIAAIMLFIIAVSIFINMRMTINDRLQEIGTLRAMGTERGDITGMFISENVFLSVFFAGLGIAAGLVIILVMTTVVKLPADGVAALFLNRGHFVLRPTIGSMFGIILIVSLFTAIFSYFPAHYGSRIPPVVALNKTT